MVNFGSWSLRLLGAVFAGAAAVVWVAGSRLAGYVDQISTRTGMGKGFAGLVLLGGILGTNLFNAVLTALFLAGLVERRDRTVLRMGWDSLAALICYAGGIAVLYFLRDQTGG